MHIYYVKLARPRRGSLLPYCFMNQVRAAMNTIVTNPSMFTLIHDSPPCPAYYPTSLLGCLERLWYVHSSHYANVAGLSQCRLSLQEGSLLGHSFCYHFQGFHDFFVVPLLTNGVYEIFFHYGYDLVRGKVRVSVLTIRIFLIKIHTKANYHCSSFYKCWLGWFPIHHTQGNTLGYLRKCRKRNCNQNCRDV
ncbi:hypothetical protein UFOVP222_121 [uncultured Caudovirales phage]|uniref:Uncharacterized protein n=1 Tax=uncultured Caudovirales phage TaxID=2100421 RepID=A0A6J7WPN3_9CAUD|nr:hypothetical protein UFOVP108_116 [uncultured Caudovirales phage]CAB5219730.1 hypothetical protein UFOVP222_121 [uncultured Caudovirales phage]